MSAILLVTLLVTAAAGATAWTVKSRSRWQGNGLMVLLVAELLWAWLIVAAHGGGFPLPVWSAWGVSHLVVAGVGWGVARWMGDALPGVDGRGWFHLSTVVAAALMLSLGLGSAVLALGAWDRWRTWGAGVNDALIVLTVLGGAGVVLWVVTVVSMVVFLLQVRRGRQRRAPRDADAVVVLGAGLVADRVSDLLSCRCDRGAAAWRTLEAADPATTAPLIVSGGRGEDEPVTEAEAMHRYLAGRGFPRDVVLEERSATDTTENLHFSLDLLAGQGVAHPFIVVCTSDFHVMRTGRILEMLREERAGNGRPFDGVVLGAPTPKPSLPAAYLREYVALMIHRVLGRA
ncbi:YdcF family protein [Corynebacterium kalidii]|uniref:YdcF family protein n=1 Tax=Corynebacterium kalidii TaxID=2931982 RepID=A0A9X1WFD8_9CORY|nr:YdcF family protein [Corynebacterium kalidii]MCJ7857994.1 YdcF family protein [Corynebacterium kalidii]